MPVSSSVNITELIGEYPLGPLQIRIIVLCSIVALLEGFDILAIGAAATAMAESLHIAPNHIGLLLSATLLGLILGAFGLGPIADRHGRRCVLIGATATFGVFTLCTAIAGTLEQVLLFPVLRGSGSGVAQCQASSVSPRNIRRDQNGRRWLGCCGPAFRWAG